MGPLRCQPISFLKVSHANAESERHRSFLCKARRERSASAGGLPEGNSPPSAFHFACVCIEFGRLPLIQGLESKASGFVLSWRLRRRPTNTDRSRCAVFGVICRRAPPLRIVTVFNEAHTGAAGNAEGRGISLLRGEHALPWRGCFLAVDYCGQSLGDVHRKSACT